MTRKKLYIFDVSGFIFRAYFALPPMASPQGEPVHALFGFVRSVLKFFKEFQPTYAIAVFDGPQNKLHRTEMYEEYKANRTREVADLPEQIDKAYQFCKNFGLHTLAVPGVEADDTMGSIALWAENQEADVYLVSGDKDLCQLVSDHIFVLNPWKENLCVDRHKVEELYGVPPEKIVDLLAMMGDSSDNIPGITGIGPKTAVSLLQEFGSLEAILANPEKVPGKKKQETLLKEADIARLSKKLATIHTEVPFEKDFSLFARQETDLNLLRAFYQGQGFHSLVKELDLQRETLIGPLAAPKNDFGIFHIVDDETALSEMIALLNTAPLICFDVETTSLDPMNASLVGIGLGIDPKESFYVPINGKLGKEYVLNALRPLFENPDKQFFGHHVKYDTQVLENEGIQISSIGFDTILASYILNSGTRRHSLDELTLFYFGLAKTPIKSLIGTGKKEISMMDVPIPKVAEYCGEDIVATLRLKDLLAKELEERKLSPLLQNVELPLSIVLRKMERHGIFVDIPYLHAMSKEVNSELSSLENDIYGMAGETFNLNSPKQLSEILFEKLQIKPLKKTATGLSTRAEVLEVLADDYPIARKILEYRLLEKLRSTYIDALPLFVNAKTGRIHPNFNQSVTATGRLACQDPNLQNIPIRSGVGRKIRIAFRPEKKGWSFLSADYSQIELRLLAHLSEDENLLKAFAKGEDIHAFTASLIFNTPLEDVTAVQRDQAKAINFGIIYGQQAYGLSQELGIDVKEASLLLKPIFYVIQKYWTLYAIA